MRTAIGRFVGGLRLNVHDQHDSNSNMTAGLDGSSYTYDAQNRLISASTNGTTDTFTYDTPK
jgi:hypothetical protein